MPTPKLFVRQYKAKDKKVYIIYRYKDDKNKNYEYQIYELVESRNAAQNLGAPKRQVGRKSELNTREMCDWVWENADEIDKDNKALKK